MTSFGLVASLVHASESPRTYAVSSENIVSRAAASRSEEMSDGRKEELVKGSLIVVHV